MLSRSPYAHMSRRRCSRGTLYNPSAGGCPCCRVIACRYRRIKPLPLDRPCRHCGQPIRELDHWNQYLHQGCREARRESRDPAVRDRRRRRTLAAKKLAGGCRKGACRRPRLSQATVCAYHQQIRRAWDARNRQRRRELGVCKDCRRPVRPGGVYCEGHLATVRAVSARWRERRAA